MNVVAQEPDNTCNEEPIIEDPSDLHRSLTGFSHVIEVIILVSLPVVGILFILDVPIRLGLAIFTEQYLGIFLTLCLAGTFLTLPVRKRSDRRSVPWFDWVLAGLAFPAGLYLTFKYPDLVANLGRITFEQVFFGALAILLILEALRRLVGLPMLIIIVVIVLYALFAEFLPVILGGRSMSFGRLINYLYLDPNSMLWMLMLAATIGMGFVFFGQVLIYFGAGQTLTDLATILCGWTRGGSAKTAVIGSGLVGTITGAPMSNVFLTGTITIPMMKAAGFSSRTAGAVEAVASSGGQIMPPVMGIAAFIIAENLGVSYATVAIAALLPAILYYLSIYMMVDLEAAKLGIVGLTREQMPSAIGVFKRSWVTLIALGILVYTLFIARMSAGTAAITSGLLCIPLFALLAENRKTFFQRVAKAFEESGRMLLLVGAVMAAAGLVVGAFNISGMSFSLSYLLSEAGKNSVIFLLVGAAVASMILGMGMPSAPAYALVAILIAPALVTFGILPMSAHLFIFYFSIISNITPPVALACFAAAPLAKENPMKIGWTAMRLAITIYIVPFAFVFSPALIMQGSPVDIFFAFVKTAVAVIFFTIGVAGYFFKEISLLRRVFFLAGGGALFFPFHFDSLALVVLNVLGLVVILVTFLPEIRIIGHRIGFMKAATVSDSER